MKNLPYLLSFTMVVGGAVSVEPQAPARALVEPDAIYQQPFSAVTAGTVRELGNGRVIVADTRDRIVQLIDFASGSATIIGRDGSGPVEFRQPVRLFAASGDTTFLVDRGNRRLLVIGPDGKPVSSFRVEPMPVPGASAGNGRFFYTQGQAVLFGSNGPVAADSVPIIRFDRTRSILDTVAWVRPPRLKMEKTSSGGVSIDEANPLNAADTWMALPDGSVAVVRVADYHVEFTHPNGRVTRGAPIPYSPIRITTADKDAEEARRNQARQNAGRGRSLSTGAPGAPSAPAQGAPPPNNVPLPPLTGWPEVKPPFRWIEAILARPNGELWIQRTEPAGAKGSLFDVINAQGAVTHQVRVPQGWTLVGFGNGTAYTIKRDQDDLVYLQRHRVRSVLREVTGGCDRHLTTRCCWQNAIALGGAERDDLSKSESRDYGACGLYRRGGVRTIRPPDLQRLRSEFGLRDHPAQRDQRVLPATWAGAAHFGILASTMSLNCVHRGRMDARIHRMISFLGQAMSARWWLDQAAATVWPCLGGPTFKGTCSSLIPCPLATGPTPLRQRCRLCVNRPGHRLPSTPSWCGGTRSMNRGSYDSSQQ